MSEEFVNDIIEETKTETPVENLEVSTEPAIEPATETPNEAEPSIEDLATQIGWNPDYQGEDAVSAATFILKSREIQDSMQANNKDLKNQLSNVQNSVEALKEHNERVYQADLKQKEAEIAYLKKEKLAAVELADVQKVTELDAQIEDIQNDLSEPEIKTTENNPDYEEWIEDNQWYLTNNEMASYAEAVAQQYQNAPRDRVYKIVRQKVAEVFPEQFASSNSNELQKPIGPASPVEASTKTVSTSKFTKDQLSPEQTTIMKQFVAQGIMSEDQYINDIAKMQEA